MKSSVKYSLSVFAAAAMCASGAAYAGAKSTPVVIKAPVVPVKVVIKAPWIPPKVVVIVAPFIPAVFQGFGWNDGHGWNSGHDKDHDHDGWGGHDGHFGWGHEPPCKPPVRPPSRC
jgi:hypothetical protein